MPQTVADQLIQRLQEWGVSRLYGYPGDGYNAILAALQRAGNQPPFVQSRHEEMSAFMATGHAKFSGEAGVCMATSGPGAIHLLNGLYDAKLDHVPVVAIVGQTNTTALGGSYQQEVDLQTLYTDVAAYVQTIMTPEQLPAVLDRAFRVAMSERTVAALIFPADIQDQEYEPPGHAFKMVPGSLGYARPRVVAPEDEIRRAADVTGSIGLLGTKPSYDLMMGCDTLLMVGSSFPYSQFLPEFGEARGIQIDIDAKMIGLRYPMEVNLIGDAQATLAELLPLLQAKTDRSWRERIERGIEEWWQVVEARALMDAQPLNPQRVFWELSPRLPHDVIVTADSGSAANWYARDLKFRAGMRGSLSGTLATMGPGMPYAIGAKFANPTRPVIACVGDGAMQMNGMAELLTVAKYYRQWDDPRFVCLVLHNNDLNQVTWEMRAMEGIPKFEETQVIPDISYAKFAELAGLRGITVDKPDDVAAVWDEALASDVPVVVDAIVDPEVPPLPPHVEFAEVKHMVGAVMKGDPNAWRMVKQSFKGKAQEFLP